MEPKIIPFLPAQAPGTTKINRLVEAAWNFAHAILWKDLQFAPSEIEDAKTHIRYYFMEADNKKNAFLAFCERIILTDKYIRAGEGRYVPSPSVWFNRYFEHGFRGTKSWYRSVEAKRKEVPSYLKHFSILARHYYAYVLRQTPGTIQSCRHKLLLLNAKSMLQIFYNTIVHFNYSIR